jgi:tetratricopeptide (TPR) repeat protein
LRLAGALREADIKGLTDQVEAVARQFELDEARRVAEQVDVVTTDSDELRSRIETLLDLNEVRAAIEVGRKYLKEERYDTSLEIFLYIDTRIDETHDLYRKVLSNIGYSFIGLGQYERVLDYLHRIEPLDDGIHFRVWHAVAIACCYHHLGNEDLYQEWLARARRMPGYARNASFFRTLYPEIAADLK